LTLQCQRAGAALPLAEGLLASPGELARDSTLQAQFSGIVARCYFELRQPAAAEQWAERALALNPQSTAAWRVLGGLAFDAQRYGEAIRWWERLVDYRQTSVDVLLPLALACQRDGRTTAARRYVDRVLAQEPQNTTARRLRASLG
jgi:tetratricopeptide (TPR) repeat protein